MVKSLIQIICFLIFVGISYPLQAQFITTTDNENSSFSGAPDNDLDQKINIFRSDIEFSIYTSGMPAENVQLAIKAFDVDPGEDIEVSMNGTSLGKLRGQSGKWVICKLDVPLNLWISGRNKIVIYKPNGIIPSYITVDWGQLIVDGGTGNGANFNRFRLDQFDKVVEGTEDDGKIILYNELDININSGTYEMQVQLVDYGISGNEQYEYVVYGSADFSQLKTMILKYNVSNVTKKYICRAFLVNVASQEIVDWKEYEFNHTIWQGPDPFYLKFENSIKTLTKENITIECTEFNNYKNLSVQHILLPDNSTTTNRLFSYEATDNGVYTFKVVLQNESEFTFKHNVNNIDRVAPVLSLYGNAYESFVEEGTYVDAGVQAYDNFNGDISSSVATENSVNPLVPGSYTVKYNVTDHAGNAAEEVVRNVEVTNKPLEVNTTSPTQTVSSVTFNGNLNYLGSTSILAHGFVWSLLPNPTVESNLGSYNLGTISAKSAFQYQLTTLEMGATYHVRSYASNADGTVYGNNVEFTYNGINYGTLDIENATYSVDEGGSVSINVVRSGGSEGSIELDYTTLNGNAVSGSEFVSKSGKLYFADGETSKTITIQSLNNSTYTGQKQFYIEISNPSKGAINRSQCSVKVDDNQIKPDDFNFSTQTLLVGPSAYNLNGVTLNYDLNLAGYDELKLTNQLQASMYGEKYSDNEGAFKTDDLSQITFFHSNTQVGYISDNKNFWQNLSDVRMVGSSTTLLRIATRGVAQGLGDDVASISFRSLSVTLKDVVSPSILSITSNIGTYIFNDKIYFGVRMSERVLASGATLTLNTGNTGLGTATLVAGNQTNCLLFEYSVREGDNISDVIVTDISGVTDYQPNNVNKTILPYAVNGVDVDGILPGISLVPQNALDSWAKSHSIQVNVTNSDFQKYAWSRSTSMPGSGWTDFTNGSQLTINSGDGYWYLHVYSSRNNGNSKYVRSNPVFLDNTDPTIELNAPSNWINGNVEISANLIDDHPSSLIAHDGYIALDNGTYLFTAFDEAGNESSNSITISNIDKVPPTIQIETNGSGVSWIDAAGTVVNVDDDRSGINNFQYLWNATSETPANGWIDFAGTTTFLSENMAGTRYLHIKAIDSAGNVAYANSNAFWVDNEKPILNLSAQIGSEWTSNDQMISVSADKTTGQLLQKVICPDNTEFLADAGVVNESYTVVSNGVYWFTAIDGADNLVEKKWVISTIDKEAPIINYTLSPSEWTNGDVNLTLSVNDELSPMYDEEGNFIGYGSSGGLEIKENLEPFVPFTENISKIVSANTSYLFEVRDVLGNNTKQTIAIANIDKVLPEVSTSNHNYSWQTTNFEVPLTFSDDISGISSKMYSVSTTTEPGVYSDYTGTILISNEGVYYVHYKAVDAAGNELLGYFGPYKLDKTGPQSVSLSGNLTYGNPQLVGSAGVDNISGLHETETYQFAINGVYGEWMESRIKKISGLIPNKQYAFKFKTKNNAGLTTESSELKMYTKALPPSAELISSTNSQLTFSISHNPENDLLADCYYRLKEYNGGALVEQTNYTFSTTLVFSGLTPGTSYRLDAIPRNADGVAPSAYLILSNAVTNRSPAVNNDAFMVYKNHTLAIEVPGVLSNDFDEDGNEITAELESGLTEGTGTLNLHTDGSFDCAPANDFLGKLTFTYRSNDGYVSSDSVANVSIEVLYPSWNGVGLCTNTAFWNGKELPAIDDDVRIESGVLNIASTIQFNRMDIQDAQVMVGAGGTLILNECSYSGQKLKAENGGTIIINGDILSDSNLKIKVNSGVRIRKGIKF